MVKPTILKPTILNGNGVYNNGAGGGGGETDIFFNEKIGNRTYRCRKIGNIAVTCENIKEITPDINFNPIGTIEEPAAWFYNGGNEEIFKKAGMLYNAFALPYLNFDSWHVITKSEIDYILSFLSNSYNAKSLKSDSDNWINSNGIDLICLSFEPCGRREPNGNFDSLNYYSNNWTSTQKDSISNYAFTLSYNADNFSVGGSQFKQAYSVRLVKSL